jgi:lipid II:glycine glycyltransferase (peptidoglycan interpeptide bridge formation enzyme)
LILKPVNNLDDFCERAEPAVGVFASRKWLAVYGKELTVIGIYKDENQLIGGFYFLPSKKLGFNFIKLPPYTPHCALFFQSDGKNASSLNNFSKEVMSEVCNYISARKAAITILAFPYTIKDFQHFIWSNYKVIPNYTYQVKLSKTLEEIKSHFDSKHRNAIAKAIKEGVEVACNTVEPQMRYNFFTGNLQQSGANIYEKELRNILFDFSDESNSFTFSASFNNKLVGMVHCIYDKNNCYYLLGGVDKSAGVQGVNNLLVQHSIEKAKELGCSTFDFEGSMLKGVEKFFRGFGPELVPYYTVNKANVFIEILLKFYKRNIF